MKNIVLIGLPGSGKSTLGKILSQRLKRDFIDLDNQIETEQQMTIGEIFRSRGEKAFRDLESRAAQKAAAQRGAIIAAGGGAVLRQENMQALSAAGIIIFLDKNPRLIAEEIDTSQRPLMQEGSGHIFKLHEERLPLYEKYGDFRIKNNGASSDALKELTAIAGLEQAEAIRLAVIGSPIGHSLSPVIHEGILGKYYPSLEYRRSEVSPGGLADWMAEARRQKLTAFNITMPHKRAILPFLDEIKGEAEKLGIVNAVIRREQAFVGYNTDGPGFSAALSRKGYALKGSRITLLGAGGAGAILALQAAQEGAARLTIAAREVKKAQDLAARIKKFYPETSMIAVSWEEKFLEEQSRETDICINATPLGMTGTAEDFKDLRFIQALPERALVCDLIYSPAITSFMAAAQRRGLETMGGLSMLICQAILADRLFLPGELLLEAAYQRAVAAIKKGARV